MAPSPLTVDEFTRAMTLLREDNARLEARGVEAFRGIHERLDVLNGRTRKLETEIALLQDWQARTDPLPEPKRRFPWIKAGIGAISGLATLFRLTHK